MLKAQDIWHQSRVSIQEIVRKSQALLFLKDAQRQSLFHRSVRHVTTLELADLTRIIAREMPRLGIEYCGMALYESAYLPGSVPELSRMVLAYQTDHTLPPIAPDGTVFRTRQLALPDAAAGSLQPDY